jgi:hypothetical protein
MIFGIGGEKRTGKDTVADILVHDFGFEKFSLADPLKEFCSQYFNIPIEYFNRDDLKGINFATSLWITPRDCEIIVTRLWHMMYGEGIPPAPIYNHTFCHGPRQLLQYVGTELGRGFICPDLWVSLLHRRTEGISKIVLPDCRFGNEREFISMNGGTLIRVHRPGVKKDPHVSENSLGLDDEYDFVVRNRGTVEDLREKINNIYKEVNDEKKGV